MLNFKNIKNEAQLHAKNILGWRTNRKIIVFAVDDYGNVRLDSKTSRENLDRKGLKVLLRFDAFDSLENRSDLEMLYETLSSVKDRNGFPAKFTPFAVPCNINFEKMTEENYADYQYEYLPLTFDKLSSKYPSSYEGAWKLWNEGISHGLMAPQFHGREHINLKVFSEKLKAKDQEVMVNLANRSYTSISGTGYPTIDWSAAFDFWEFKETKEFGAIIEDGLNAFEKVFGYRSVHFNAPGKPEHRSIHGVLKKNGVKYIDTPLVKKEHQGLNVYKTEINYPGKQNPQGIILNTRNVIFEPTEEKNMDWVNYTMKQIGAAFLWKHPAVISSHRVNFCGNISEKNREKGISSLKTLLLEIVKKWPEVEFMSSAELMDLISNQNKQL